MIMIRIIRMTMTHEDNHVLAVIYRQFDNKTFFEKGENQQSPSVAAAQR